MELMLNRLADAAQVTLSLSKGAITGSNPRDIPTTLPGLKLRLSVGVEASFANDQMGVLLSLAGDLFVLIAHNDTKDGGATSAFFIDGSKVKTASGNRTDVRLALEWKKGLKETVTSLGSAVVSSFYRKTGGSWQPLKVPA